MRLKRLMGRWRTACNAMNCELKDWEAWSKAAARPGLSVIFIRGEGW